MEGSNSHKEGHDSFDLLFVGNFVQDIIHTIDPEDHSIREAHKLGGSVTYGPLAVATLGRGCRVRVVCRVGQAAAADPFLTSLRTAGTVDLSGVEWMEGADTSYLLKYDKSGHRTLSLREKGYPVPQDLVLKHVGRPDAILFVPVAGEFDETLVVAVAKDLRHKGCRPIIAIDIQGYLRAFEGDRVCTREAEEMVGKLDRVGRYLTFLKAEYGEAQAILGLDLSPAECANGSFLATKALGVTFVPTYKPERVRDETGCGDTYLACTISELLHLRRSQHHQQQHRKTPLHSSEGALHTVDDEWGLEEIGRRIERGEVQGKESSRKSVTAYTPPPSVRRRQSLDG
ncbi:uncharacterized protein ACA1_269740 [Acanthamoeba castellanii str. Neff]|uniref:Carbohydrate kinase PfkB domain-containing protein n=1 Tax=Acanthamoeba castellanii (strain ATCC 30010 / Neff) TaxID=1257118 RepID=L8H2S0_ACACF|nr:uncharacterized protein ACA1_269740 [Acanthamoeba castellanii str. Neff]ELR19532.1 hypothetical protein ACA1_269740 [Acanthamoeba castellanii str. Neff]